MDDSLTITLRAPIKVGNDEIREITLTEPEGGQLRKAMRAGSDMDQLLTLISLNAGLPPSVVDRMKQRDIDEAASFFVRFSGKPESTLTPSTTSSDS